MGSPQGTPGIGWDAKHNVGLLQELVLLPNGWWLDFDSLLTCFWPPICQWEVLPSFDASRGAASQCVWTDVESEASKKPNARAQLVLYGTRIRPANSLRTRMHNYRGHLPLGCTSGISDS